jgi:hypothetical protein
MTNFQPTDMARSRGQTLYRHRPGQTFDHPAGFISQVRQYGRDDAFSGSSLDPGYLIDEAMNYVRRWRNEGGQASAAVAGSDRAPEFPDDTALARQHYDVVIPGKVYCRVWPLMTRCAGGRCGRVWEAPEPRAGIDTWPPRCPTCGNERGNRQLQYVFVHGCGEVSALRPPECPRHHTRGFRLNDQVSRFKDFRWECLECGVPLPVRAFCPNRSCQWVDKMMSPQVHTASSAYSGHGRTLVNVPRAEFARSSQTPAFIIATLARWLGECSPEEARALKTGGSGGQVPAEVLESIRVMESTGLPALLEQARQLRRRFAAVDVESVRERVTTALGYDPLAADTRGRLLAEQVGVFERILELPVLTLDRLQQSAAGTGRAERYRQYAPALQRAGFDPSSCMLVSDFPVLYLGIGFTRGGFGPREADLVAYKGRAGRGQAVINLLYASPTYTEAIVFSLDHERVAKWLVANGAASSAELLAAGGVKRWFASRLDPEDGQLPRWDPDEAPRVGDVQFGPRALFGLLHSAAHQVLRALAVDSGYSETALSEYLFPYELSFAIHPNGGSEFTIGGLRTVLEQNLDEVVDRAFGNATCIYDPNCMVANRGADHGCLQLPETTCQMWNRFMSRWDLYGSPDGNWTGYWDPALSRSALTAAAAEVPNSAISNQAPRV